MLNLKKELLIVFNNDKSGGGEKGVSLYLGLMIMIILLAIGLGVSTIIVSQMKMIKGMGDSVIAFHAADTGIEKALYDHKICYQSPCSSPPCTAYCSGVLKGYTTSGNLGTDISYSYSHDHTTEGPPEYPPGDPNYPDLDFCPDYNGDGITDDQDALILSASGCWGKYISEYPECYIYDISSETIGIPDGYVDMDDIYYIKFRLCDYTSYYFESVGTFKGTKRAIEITIY